MIIALTGFPGSGKSCVGRELSALTGWPLTDLDEVVEKMAGKSVADIFADDGEEAFRQLETEALHSLDLSKNGIIALGGGSLLRPENAAILKGKATVVWLKTTPENLMSRLVEGMSGTRPLLVGNVQGKLGNMLENRAGHYEGRADITVSTDDKNPASVAREIYFSVISI